MPKVEKLVERIINQQFEMTDCPLRWRTLPEDGLVEVSVGKKKKRVLWWQYYYFTNEQQWKEWREWAEEELRKDGMQDVEEEMNYIDLRWGMAYKVERDLNGNKEKGDQLDLF